MKNGCPNEQKIRHATESKKLQKNAWCSQTSGLKPITAIWYVDMQVIMQWLNVERLSELVWPNPEMIFCGKQDVPYGLLS